MILLLASFAAAHVEKSHDRAPVAWALSVEGHVVRNDGTWLDPGEALEPGATLTLPIGARATVVHNGRIERWEGPSSVRIGDRAAVLHIGGTRLVHAHVEDVDNSLTGAVRVPLDRAQATSAVGIPLTAAAWARQDLADHGALHALYRDALTERLARDGVDRGTVEKLGLLDSLPGDVGDQISLVGRYLDLAAATPDAAVVFELHPTDGESEAVGRNLLGTTFEGLVGERPHTFRAPPLLDQVRLYGKAAADRLRASGHTVFALVVPYANTLENIVARSARPLDGVENLHQYLVRAGGLGGQTTTVAVGYSQGAAVVREYVGRYGDNDGLDYAIALAVMGGADGAGQDGVWAGKAGEARGGGVSTLSVVHMADPARNVHGKGVFALIPSLLAFSRGGANGEDRALHDSWYGPHGTPIPPGADAAAALAVGLLGYPAPLLAPLFDDLFAGRYAGVWARRGDWRQDARAALVAPGRGDYTSWRVEPRTLADGYLE